MIFSRHIVYRRFSIEPINDYLIAKLDKFYYNHHSDASPQIQSSTKLG